jgi:hypothetical protein
MFAPTLSPAGAATMSGMVAMMDQYLGLADDAAQFGRGLLVNTADVPGKRRSFSGACEYPPYLNSGTS